MVSQASRLLHSLFVLPSADRNRINTVIFNSLLVVTTLAALAVGLGTQDVFYHPGRIPFIRGFMLSWPILNLVFWYLARKRAQLAYLGYTLALYAMLSIVFQLTNVDALTRILMQMMQNGCALFIGLLLLPFRLFLVFSTISCVSWAAWVLVQHGEFIPPHGKNMAIALLINIAGFWVLTLVGAWFLEAFNIKMAESHSALSRFNAKLKEEVDEQAALIRKQDERVFAVQKMEAIGLLAGGIAHDFNNKLTIVKGFGELLAGKVGPGSAEAGWVRNILEAAGDAGLMTRQLLSFSRREMIAPRNVSLNSAIETRREVFRCLLGEHIDLAVTLDPLLGNCLFDPGQLEEVIVNLVLNARDALGSGGRLEIRTENVEMTAEFARSRLGAQEGPHVSLTVKDSGSGMTPETMSHLFEPFFTTKPKGKGTGLGLATVYGIVRQNGGFIDVESSPAHGSSFRIFIPRSTGEVEPVNVRPVVASSRVAGGTILVVEDELRLLELTREILSNAGYQVIIARGPHEAILKSREAGEIHLLLCDVIMADGGAGRTVSEITAHRPGIPVLYMSGYADETIAEHGIIDQEKDFLRKPFSPIELLDRIEDILSRAGGGGAAGMPNR